MTMLWMNDQMRKLERVKLAASSLGLTLPRIVVFQLNTVPACFYQKLRARLLLQQSFG